MPGACRGLGIPAGLFLALLSLISFEGRCGWPESLRLESATEAYLLGRHVEYLEDRTGHLRLEEVSSSTHSKSFRQSHQAAPSFGFTDSIYWFRLALENSDPHPGRWLLEFQYPLLDQVDLFLLDAGGVVSHQQSGDRLAFSQRTISERVPLFLVEIPPESTREIYFRVESSSSLQLPITLWSERAYHQADHDRQILFGIYYGITLALLVYNIMLFVSLRDRIYLFYVAYIGCFSLFQASLNGLSFEYLWPESALWAEKAAPFFMSAASIMAIQFSRLLLQIDREMPTTDKAFRYFMGLLAIIALYAFWGPYSIVVKLATAGGLIASLALNVVGWISWMAKVKFASYYVLSWTSFLLGSSIYALKTIAVLPENFITEYSIQVGSALEVMLLSFALAYRVKLLEEENKRIQSEANLRLEHRVNERTEELNDALRHLSEAKDKLERLSQIDNLTGVYNRNYFDVHYPRIWNLAQRADDPLTLMMIDIDHFKKVNDTHGHLCGDKVLRAVAVAISTALARNTDLLARYGGEEFVAVLPHTDKNGGLLIAERLRSAVEKLRVEWEGIEIKPKVSVGLASLRPTLKEPPASLILKADHALYGAKKTGRNRVICESTLTIGVDLDRLPGVGHSRMFPVQQ